MSSHHISSSLQVAHKEAGLALPRVKALVGLTCNDFRPGPVLAISNLGLYLFPPTWSILISVCRHPLDQQNTRVLQLLPGLEMLTKSIMGERHAKCGTYLLVKPCQVCLVP